MTLSAPVKVETPGTHMVLTRVFDAPREMVYAAWTDAKQFAQWWGPKGFTNPVCELDVRPGGAYRVTMRAPDGTEHPITGVFREVVAPEKLVMTMVPTQARNCLTTVTFEAMGKRTRLTVTQVFDSEADRDWNVGMGAPTGWTQSFVRLDELLGRKS